MPNNNTPHDLAVIYCRVSSDRQAADDKTSLDDQERRGRETATRLGVHVLYVARHAESAWMLDKRSQFQGILVDARAGKFSVLIVDRMDRFSRSEDLSDPLLVLRELKDLGIRVEFSDRQYSQDVVGQMMMLFEMGMSAREQQERRKASRNGKIGRARLGLPLPTRRPPYGYVWADPERKTQLVKDPGEASAVVERIWQYFLHYTPTTDRPRPTVRNLRTLLNADHVPTPTMFHGVQDKKGNRHAFWNDGSLQVILHNGIYWGEPKPALSQSKFTAEQPPIPIPAYAPTYVTPAEAARVHDILAQNAAHTGRPRKKDHQTLLHAGLVYCGYCGHRMDPIGFGRKLSDGTRPIRYRCNQRFIHGLQACSGTTILASTLDWAVRLTLDEHLRKGQFLDRLFAAWDADETAAQGQVRIAQAALDDARQQVASLVASSARHAPNTAAWASIQVQLDRLNDLVPSLEKRVSQAQAAVNQVRGSVALRDELKGWFAAWLDGFYVLPLARQREFLFAVHARVNLWRATDRNPRAELVIGLPSNTLALALPPAPDITVTDEGWHLPLDVEHGSRIALAERGGLELPPETPEDLARRQEWEQVSAESIMERVAAELDEQDANAQKQLVDRRPTGRLSGHGQ
jgi:DNA invertase Pin-like site-specific DNA recombinase